MSAEIELKLLLPGASPANVVALLRQCPALAQTAAQEQWLLNRYYDTPQQLLRQQRAALRLRQVSHQPWSKHSTQAATGADETWWQTFKTAGVSHGGLSQRGEWECRVARGELDEAALSRTPWADLDPKGQLLAELQPCFETHCHRTTWHLQAAPDCEIEVALDVGEIVAGDQVLPMLELELELLSGPPQALFELAQQIGQQLALLPCDVSKAERGYALAQGTAHHPAQAKATHLRAGSQPLQVAAHVMSEMFEQLTRNLAGLLYSEDPELVHQARVAWRRWRSACRLFRPWLPALPERQLLRPWFEALGQLRDLDVARVNTLPRWTPAFVQNSTERQAWVDAAVSRLSAQAAEKRLQLRQGLQSPELGRCWLEYTTWLFQLHASAKQAHSGHKHWAQQRMAKLHRRLEQSLAQAQAPLPNEQSHLTWHQARLQAKRTRYSLETVQDLLPRQRVKHWGEQATALQQRLGHWRDAEQTAHLLAKAEAAPELLTFIQGVAAALAPHPTLNN